MRVALFVEGGLSTAGPRQAQTRLEAIWAQLADLVGFVSGFSVVVPISKKNLVAMHPVGPNRPKISGAGEGLDLLMVRTLARAEYDAAVLAWDLVPAWNPVGTFCRWRETLDVYRLLAASAALPDPWRAAADRRHQEMEGRIPPSARRGPHRLTKHETVVLCMEPMFEDLLFLEEQDVLAALGISARPTGWPRTGWGRASRTPDEELLKPIIRALRSGPAKQWPRVAKKIRASPADKDPWIEYLLRQLLRDKDARARVLAHPYCSRLAECLT